MRRVEGKADTTRCPIYANIFRCISYRQFLHSSDFVSKNAYQKMDSQFLAFERELSDTAILTKNFTKEKGRALTEELTLLEKEYTRYVQSHKIDFTLWDSIKFRTISFRMQIKMLMEETE